MVDFFSHYISWTWKLKKPGTWKRQLAQTKRGYSLKPKDKERGLIRNKTAR